MSRERTRILGAVVLAVVALAMVVGGNLWKRSLTVRQVVVQGTLNVEPNQIVQLAGVATGTPLYEVDLTRVQRNVQSHYFVRHATVERDLPGSIRITVEERVPLAVAPGEDLVYLDDAGMVLPSSISKAVFDLPVVTGIARDVKLRPGTVVEDADVRESLVVLGVLKSANRELFHRISEVQLRNGGDIILYSAEWGVPIIFGHGNIADKVARLESFWAAVVAERGAQQLQYVDLRYERQVVARWAPAGQRAL